VASGADLAGAQWATSAGLPVIRFTLPGRRRPSVLGNANVFVKSSRRSATIKRLIEN
jgi:hypothetical protein